MDSIIDISGNNRHGVLVNAPTRAVKGHDWDGSQPDWTKATYGYGAIHFHEDDLDDAGWSTNFSITIPSTARSGAYAIELRCPNAEGVREAKEMALEICEETFTGVKYPKFEVERGFRFWDVVRCNGHWIGVYLTTLLLHRRWRLSGA